MDGRTWWRCVALMIVGMSLLIQWHGHRCGLLLTYDSYQYLAAARSFAATGSFINADGSAYVYWPPLFPVLLSQADDPLTAMYWINFIVMAAIGVMCALLGERMISNALLRIVFLITTLCGVHVMMSAVFLWSELIFVFLMLVFLFAFERAGKSRAWIAVALVGGLLLCMQRNAGLFIVSGAMLWYVVGDIKQWKLRAVKALLWWGIATSGFWIWNVYISYVASTGFAIHDQEYFGYLLSNLTVMADGILYAWVPVHGWSVVGLLAGGVALAVVLRKRIGTDRVLQLMGIVVVSYLAGMSLLFELDFNDSDRYACVVVPLAGLVVFRGIDEFLSYKPYSVKVLVLILSITWMAYPLGRTLKNVKQWHEISCAPGAK